MACPSTAFEPDPTSYVYRPDRDLLLAEATGRPPCHPRSPCPLTRPPVFAGLRFPAPSRGVVGGWSMLLMATLAMALTAPGQTAAISVFVDPMLADLGLGRSAISAAYLVGTLVGALAMPWTGRAIDRFGVRRVMVPVALAFGAALIGFSFVEGIWGMTVGFLAVRMLGQGALTLITTTAVALSFQRRRGAALGIVLALGSVGISLAPLHLERIIAEQGWRTAWVIEGLVIWAVLLPIAVVGLRRRRPTMALTLGDGSADPSPARAWGLTRGQALREPFFWLVTAAVAAAAMLATAVAFHQIDLLGERGLTPGEAAANFLPQTIAGLAATLVMGIISDRVAPRPLLASSTALLAASLLLATAVGPGWSSLAFGAVIGLAAGSIRALEAATLPRYFGVAHVGSIRGVVMAVGVGASAFGPILFAVGHDVLGSYGPTLVGGALIPIGLTVAALVIEPPGRTGQLRRTASHPAPSPAGPLVALPTSGADGG